MKHTLIRWLTTLSFSALILSAEPTVAFWFCPPMSSGQSTTQASSLAQPPYSGVKKEKTKATYPLLHKAGFSENKSSMPSPLERSRPGMIEPPLPHPAYPRGPIPDIRFEKDSDADNYYLIIYLSGYQPEDIAVAVDRGGLIIYNVRSEEHRHQAAGYYQHVTSFRRFTRRISLPPDADPTGLTRTDRASKVEVVVPRMR